MDKVEQPELNARERCGGSDQNQLVEGNAGGRKISVVTDAELEKRKDARIPVNTRMNTLWATRVWKDWGPERNRKINFLHSTEETVTGSIRANTDEQLNKWLAKFVEEVRKIGEAGECYPPNSLE